MSQQINLLNPALRPRRDWLSLPALVAAVLVILVIEGGLYAKASYEHADLSRQLAQVNGENKRIQEELLVLSKSLAAQIADPALTATVEERAAEVKAGEDMLRTLDALRQETAGFSAYFQGFARQAMDGLWLTDFTLGAGGLSIKGRMQETTLLPVYIRRLNAEPNFQGREFSALDMKTVEPAKGGDGKVVEKALPTYTEFTLQGVLPGAEKAKP